jgi:hypothetical protein
VKDTEVSRAVWQKAVDALQEYHDFFSHEMELFEQKVRRQLNQHEDDEAVAVSYKEYQEEQKLLSAECQWAIEGLTHLGADVKS